MTTSSRPSVGLIGAGLLGAAMAERLLEQGRPVAAWDVDQSRLDALAPAGGAPCRSAAELLTQCPTVLLSLPTSEIVGQLLEAEREALRSGQLLIDTTTGDPQHAISHGRLLSERGAGYVEATVAGSSRQMRGGRAAMFLGGEPEWVERAEPLLKLLAPLHFHLGPLGSAARFKLVHNLILGLHRAVLAEGLTLAERLGFAPSMTLEILQQTPAASQAMATKGPKMAARDWTTQARLSQHLKDVRLILAEAQRQGAPAPLSRAHCELLERAEQLGFGDADNSAVLEAYRDASR